MSGLAPPPLQFTTQQALIQRLVLATLTGRPVHISQIRSTSTEPGLASHEISFLRLLEAITNGSAIEISYTGTTLLYRPGLITGGSSGLGDSNGVIRHELNAQCSHGVSFFLIPLCLLAPFSKSPLNVLFTGPGVITSSTELGEMSVDTVRTAILPLYEQFGISNNLELRILRRSGPGPEGKGGAGEVQLVFGHQVRLPKTVHILKPGRIKRVRGVAYCIGVSASNNARVIEAARGILNPLVSDAYIFSDVSSAPFVSSTDKSSAKTKIGVGYGLSLVAESSTGSLYSADLACPPLGGVPPEEIGRHCAYQLMETITQGGCVPLVAAPSVLMLMAMGSEDVGRIRLGRNVVGSEALIGLARDLRKFGASGWGIRDVTEDEPDGDIMVSVVGRGIGNVGRKIA
jgi:RNA 3'-terminal phosphate cyclase-like protein